MKLHNHQEKFIKENPNKAVLNWEMRTGKTLAATLWLKKRKENKSLVICPKTLTKHWEDAVKSLPNVTVITRDQIKKIDISLYTVIVCDEAHDFFSPLFNKQRSARATILYNHLKDKPDTNILMCTATPIRSSPYNLHTMLCFLGIFIKVNEFNNKFFDLTDRFGRYHYEPKKEWRKAMRPYLEKYTDIVLYSECAENPPEEHIVMDFKTKKRVVDEYEEVSSEWHADHRAENAMDKYKKLEEIVDGYHKSIVIMYYREQIETYATLLRKNHTLYILNGDTKNPADVIDQARNNPECIFIVQASMGYGFEASEFNVMIFASMSFKFIDYIQATGRLKNTNSIRKNIYYYLIGGKCDRNVYRTVRKGLDFYPPHYKNNT